MTIASKPLVGTTVTLTPDPKTNQGAVGVSAKTNAAGVVNLRTALKRTGPWFVRVPSLPSTATKLATVNVPTKEA